MITSEAATYQPGTAKAWAAEIAEWPRTEPFAGTTLLVLATGRMAWWESMGFVDGGVDGCRARSYAGGGLVELWVEGSHMSVAEGCVSDRCPEFTSTLKELALGAAASN